MQITCGFLPGESGGCRCSNRGDATGCAGEGPFFVTYTHQMEETANLEIATINVTGQPAGGNRFIGQATELEYGMKGWWTSEFYLDGQATAARNCEPRRL